MKITAFWNIALCSLVEVDLHFIGVYCLHHPNDDDDDDEGSLHFQNTVLLLHNYTVLYPRKLSSP
jgi:hypothetical protein